MIRSLFLTAALVAGALASTATTSIAQGYYGRDRYYERPSYLDRPYYTEGRWGHPRPYSECRQKARKLHEYEDRALRDGKFSTNEKIMKGLLQADLDKSCGGGRWQPRRGWHYP
jgi:hypothetical protein